MATFYGSYIRVELFGRVFFYHRGYRIT
jgi:hypothetical protein